MALFLKGKHRGYYRCGLNECVRDHWTFNRKDELSLSIERIQRNMMSAFKRYKLYEINRIHLSPIDPTQPRLGGKVRSSSFLLDLSTLTFTQGYKYGVYGEDFIQFGKFRNKESNPFDDEELLLEITKESLNNDLIANRTTFAYNSHQLTYQYEAAPEADTNDYTVEKSEIQERIRNSWSEALFYGLGNKNMCSAIIKGR